MAKPQIIIPSNSRTYIPLIIKGDKESYVLDFENSMPVDSVVLCGLPVDFETKLTHTYYPKKRGLRNNQTRLSVLEKALEHFGKRDIDFLLADPLTCQTVIRGNSLEGSSEELLEYVSQAFVKVAPMVKRT